MPRPLLPRVVRGLVWTGLLMLALSAVLNLFLVRVSKRLYARELMVRLQPISLAPASKSGNPAGARILFLGDSRAAGWPNLPADRFQTANAGVAGETTAQILLRTETVLLSEKPEVVVIQAGINDLKAIGVMPEAAAQIQQQCAANLIEITRLCRQHHARVVFTSILPTGPIPPARRLVWSGEIAAAIRSVNATLAGKFAGDENILFLDCSKFLEPGHADYRDALHVKPAAYEKLSAALIPLLGLPPPPDQPPAARQSGRISSNTPAGR